MYLDGGMENISEPRVILREGSEGTILELKAREPPIALLSNGKLPLYASFMAKNVSLLKKCVVNDVFRNGEGIAQRDTYAKNTSVCAGVCGVSQIEHAETEIRDLGDKG